MKTKQILDSEGVAFLRLHHAYKEVVFYHSHDYWIGMFDSEVLIGTIALDYKKGYDEIGGFFIAKEFRNKGLGKSLIAEVLKHTSKAVICYARPATAHILEKYYNFHCKQEFKNGTRKLRKEKD